MTVTEAVTRLRDQYDAPLVVTTKFGGVCDIGMIVGAELTALLDDVTDDVALNYLRGVELGYQLSATRAGNVEDSTVSYTHVVTSDATDRTILLPTEFNGVQPSALIVETYQAEEPYQPVYNAVSARGRNNSGQYYVTIAECPASLMVRMIGL